MADPLSIVTAIYESLGKGDIPGMIEHLADDIHWEEWANNYAQKAGVPWLQARNGKEETLGFFTLLSTIQMVDFQVLSMMAGGNKVVVEVEIEFHVPATGRNLRDEELHLWTLNDEGKVIRMRHYTDTAKHVAVTTIQ